MPTSDEYAVSKQRQRQLYTKINLLNFKFQTVGEISGDVLSDSFTNDATADIRRTCALSLVVTDSSFNIQAGSKIWLDKYIQIYIGIKNVRTDEIVYTNMGIYMIENPNTVYSAVEHTMTISGIDLMAKMTGLRNGNLEGIEHIIPQESSIRDSMIATLALAGFTNYVIEDVTQTVPYDIKIDVGGTVYDILEELVAIVPQYQIYFDVDGVFHYEKIPSGQNESTVADDDLWTQALIDYSVNTSFDDIKNVIEVWGKCHDISNYGGTATISGSQYNITVSTITTLRDNLLIGFTSPSYVASPTLRINSLTAYAIVNEDGTPAQLSVANTYYVVKYYQGKFKFMGQVQSHAVVSEDNPDSPFYIGGSVGSIRIVLQGGEYDNIYTDDLARQRAEFELYSRCRLQDNVTLNCVPVYWLDTNKVVEITLPHNGVKQKYITKSITTDGSTSGTQSITMMQYYPFYPSV